MKFYLVKSSIFALALMVSGLFTASAFAAPVPIPRAYNPDRSSSIYGVTRGDFFTGPGRTGSLGHNYFGSNARQERERSNTAARPGGGTYQMTKSQLVEARRANGGAKLPPPIPGVSEAARAYSASPIGRF